MPGLQHQGGLRDELVGRNAAQEEGWCRLSSSLEQLPDAVPRLDVLAPARQLFVGCFDGPMVAG